MKTLKQWEKSKLDLDEFLTEPCQIDEALYLDILECVGATYSTDYAQQGGDPMDSFYNDDDEQVFTYFTVKAVNDKYFFLGILPEFKG